MLRVWNLSLLCATFSPHDPRHLPHPVGRPRLGARLHRVARSARCCWASSRWSWLVVGGADRLAGRPAARAGPHRLAAVAGRARSWSTTCCSPAFAFVVLLGHGVPADRRGHSNGDRLSVGAPVLRPHDDADRLRAAVPDGGRPGAAVAQGVGRAAAPTRLLWPGVVRRGSAGRRGRARRARVRRRCWRSGWPGSPPARPLRQWCWPPGARAGAGLVGRANGGMVVHLGVVLIAVAFAASSSYVRQGEFRLLPGESATVAGHTVTYEGTEVEQRPERISTVGPDPGRRRRGLRAVVEPVPQPGPGHRRAVGAPVARRRRVPDAGDAPTRRRGRGHGSGS